ncbi:nuclear transport factor 2 family protein [Herbiconiux sp. UC225_62]|uniref:nuclear transport factor 2 family protein n=1 Tax=Herbiconiux sp. UC225_62 TaxID=3350168 RepID=UPI0036D2A5F9
MADDVTAPVSRWIDGYRRAWESNDPVDIRALFTEDGEYRTEPYAEPWTGHDEIVAGWIEAQDEPGETTFSWHPVAVDGPLAVVQGTTVYSGGPVYSNLWVIRLTDDGRASEFTEWWMEQNVDDGG